MLPKNQTDFAFFKLYADEDHKKSARPGGEKSAQKDWDEEFTHYLPVIAGDDFPGIQNYTRTRHDENGSMTPPDGAEPIQMDYEYYPEGLEQ